MTGVQTCALPISSADAPSASKTGKKRPGKELKASNTRRERASEVRDAGESGNATAHAVIGIIKKKSNKSKTGEKRKRFDIPVSPDEDDVEEEIRRGKISDDHSSSFTSSSAFNSTSSSSSSSSSSKSSSDLILRISRKN